MNRRGDGRRNIRAEQMLGFTQKFNRMIVLDEQFASRLPAHEFELSFDEAGNIYVDGKSLGVNVIHRYRALRPRGSDR